MTRFLFCSICVVSLAACENTPVDPVGDGAVPDGAMLDGAVLDGAVPDGGRPDSGTLADAGTRPLPETAAWRPVVLQGVQLPSLAGAAVDRVVAYARRGGVWERVLVQVDERDLRNAAEYYGTTEAVVRYEEESFVMGVYTDDPTVSGDETFVGVDRRAGVDEDDEVVLLLGEAGDPISNADPPEGGTAWTVVEVAFPIEGGTPRTGAFLLGVSDATLAPLEPLVTQTPEFLDGSGAPLVGGYVGSYDVTPVKRAALHPRCAGEVWEPGQPEDSTVRTARYEVHFTARWTPDRLTVAGSPDLLDHHELRASVTGVPGHDDSCTRNSNTFSGGRGAILTLKSGPIRAIRSYVGANSGPHTQREHFFYPTHEEVVSRLRVHSMGNNVFADVMDWSRAVVGMTYLSATVPAGVTIDGAADDVPATFSPWELVVGTPVGHDTPVSILSRWDVTGYPWPRSTDDLIMLYRDSAGAAEEACLCSGDDEQIGASGIGMIATKDGDFPSDAPQHGWPSTDHTRPGCLDRCPGGADDVLRTFLSARRVLHYFDDLIGAEEAEAVAGTADAPLQVRTRPLGLPSSCIDACDDACWAPDCGPALGSCGDGLCNGDETVFLCPNDCGGSVGVGPVDFCGDDDCDLERGETLITCPVDCGSGEGRQGFLACVQTGCPSEYEACVSDACAEGYECLLGCAGGLMSCAESCAPTEGDRAAYVASLTRCGPGCS